MQPGAAPGGSSEADAGLRPPVRAVFFDAGNTLVRMDYTTIAAQLGRFGVETTPDDLRRAEIRARVRLDPHFAAGTSTESRQTGRWYLQYVLEGVGAPVTVLDAMLGWQRSYNQPIGVWTVPDPEALPALRLLHARRIRTGVISNSNGTVRGILDGFGLTPYLDFVLDSSEVGVEKPDARIFALALERAAVTAPEALYVGDLYTVDVLGARAAGLRGVLMDPEACWGDRDCPRVPGLLAVCELIAATATPAA
jgi:putative hydrolase of the HAD superfamily